MEKYERLEDIGWKEGGQRISKYRDTENGQSVVINDHFLKSCTEFAVPNMILWKISLLKEIKHDNVARLLDIIYKERESQISVVFEYSDVNNLRSFMRLDPVRATDRRFIRNVLQQILRGLYCYHSINVAHGSLNPLNVVINSTDFTAKITDLDMMITPSYMAPEILFDSSNAAIITPAADMFAVGCIFAEMLIRKPLFDAQSKYHEIVSISRIVGNFECYPSKPPEESTQPDDHDHDHDYEDKGTEPNLLPSSMKKTAKNRITENLEQLIPDFRPAGIDLLSRMLCPNPSARITVDQALKHSYFKAGVQFTTPTPSDSEDNWIF